MRKIVAAISLWIVLGLLLAACAPAAAPPPQAAPTPTQAATGAPAPTVTPAVVAPTPAPATGQPRYGGVLRTVGAGDLTNYDLAQVISYLDHHPLAPSYSLLIRSDFRDVDKLVPDLAERWEASPDGKVYSFYLRRGVKFHDGTTLSSRDVKASFDRMIWPPKGMISQWQAYFDAVEKIETPDDYTVKFSLKRPQPAFPTMVASPFNVIFPKALLDQKGDMKKDIMGSGPFRFKEYIRGVQFVVEKNPNYFIPERPYLDGIVRYIIPDAATAKGAFVAGRVDLFQSNPPYLEVELQEWKKLQPDLAVPKAAGLALFSFIPNVEKKPWDDVRVRRAVMLALDKDALLEHHLEGKGDRGGYLPLGPWAIPNEELLKLPGWGKQTPEDLAEAKRLLAEAGYPNGFKTSHTERNIKEYVDQAISFKGMLAKVGIDLNVIIMENAAWLIVRRSPNFETMGEAAVSVPMGEPDIVLTRYLSGSLGNYAQYKNPKLDQLYREQSQTVDVAERKKKVLEIQRMMIEDVPFMPWAWRRNFSIHTPQVKNYYQIGSQFAGQSMEQVWLAR